ncbi:MAG: hypothetical protein JSV20_03580 [Candidatus Bathyarchaeota archaeon]|nr:MAG: hypothetical protein JSV20_03580 [Candidatus Bathyarchaeota archaeon]
MKRVLVYVQQYSINKIMGNELELSLHDNADIIDAIKEIDRMILRKGKFPSKYYHSLLHWTYHPIEERFYKQASIIAYIGPGRFLNVRENPKMLLPEGLIIHINPEGPCITEGEDVLEYETFKKALQQRTP